MSVTYTHTGEYYIKNDVNKLICGTISLVPGTTATYQYLQSTGWHIVPNQQYKDWMTFKDWHHLITNYDHFRPAHCEVTLQNLIPLTDDLSIAQDTTFMSFNNTIYALTYQDKIYETHPQQFATFGLYWREGVALTNQGAVNSKIYLPTYTHRLPAYNSETAALQLAWDPMCNAEQIGELRPGKNAVSFSWSRNPADDDKWYAPARFFSIDKSYDTTDVVIWDRIDSVWTTGMLTPGQLYKSHPKNSVMRDKEIVEYKHLWKYPIQNMFTKMVTIFGSSNKLLKHEGHVVITKKITFDVKAAKHAVNEPRMDYHTTGSAHLTRTIGNPDWSSFGTTFRSTELIGQPMYYDSMEHTAKSSSTENENMEAPAPIILPTVTPLYE